MKILYFTILTAVCYLTTSWEAKGQTVENIRTTFDGDKLIISYDLIYPDPAQKFDVTLYSSHDDYARPLSLLIGDFGDKVVAGKGNRVIWDAKSSLPPDFDKDIIIQVKASKVAPPPPAVKLSMKPFDQSTYKKGRTIEIRWVGGNLDDMYTIELFRDNTLNLRIAEKVSNSQRYDWTMPKSVKSGKNYLIRMSNVQTPTDLSNSQLFEVKPRTPLIVKVLPFLAVGAAVLLIKKTPSNSELPPPPNPN